eukprot:Blabericola_migrator_1__12794@NODE_822_length_6382_cov_129_292162_g571_i1_p1_GENE_NODE_822_length_6382_cov_129_292162_g571_i1NODE_822_length_6382_cov_129_292162_g571_i1_p1_ORF_typecomplete_len551_score51_51MscS_porin/PF12795_7/0_15DUF4140/PF13600_6/0_21FXMRP1_C_core/PF12235_8/0_33HOOK/PF05622_12/0_39_NODE_822_length_6382_cov_129_292162_g571_i144286080
MEERGDPAKETASNGDTLPLSRIRAIAQSLGYSEQRQNQDCCVFYRPAISDHTTKQVDHRQPHENELPANSRVFPSCVEVYLRSGDVVTYLPHPRQKAYRIFHFGALYSEDSLAEIFRNPWNDLQFAYRLSEILAHPRDAVPPAPPPSTAIAALERQLATLERELGDIRLERSEIRRRLRQLQKSGTEAASIAGHDEQSDTPPAQQALSLTGGNDSDYGSTRGVARDGESKSSNVRHRKAYSTRQATGGDTGGSKGRQPMSSTDRENLSLSQYELKYRAEEMAVERSEYTAPSGIRPNLDRMRGNKGVWNLFFPDVKEEFARAWHFKPVNIVALGRGYVISYDDGTLTWGDLCPLLEAKLRGQGLTPISTTGTPKAPATTPPVQIKYLVLGSESNFYVKFNNGRMEWCGQDGFGECLRRGVNEKRLIVERVAFGPNGGWIVLWSDGTYDCESVPQTLFDRLRRSRGGPVLSPVSDPLRRCTGVATGIRDITVGPTGEWFIIYKDHSVQADNLPDALYKSLSQIRERSGRVRSIIFGESRSWFVRFWDGSK